MGLRVVFHPGPSFDDYTIHLVNALAQYDTLTVGLALDHGQIARFHDVLDTRVHLLPYRRPRRRHVWGVYEMQRLARAIRRFQAHIFHYQGFGLWESVLVRFLRGVTVVNTVHDPVNHIDYRTWLNETLLRDAVRTAHGWVVHSRGMALLLQQEHPTVVPEWVCIHPFGPFTYYRQRLSTPPPEEREILFFGRPRRNKGIDVLLQAFIQVAPHLPGWQLVLAGHGEIPKEARPFYQHLKREGRLRHIKAFLPDAEVARVFRRAAFVVLPYRHGTQSGILAVAAALERAVLATPVGALPEFVQHGREVFFVPPEDGPALAAGLRTLAQNPALRQRLAAQLARTARHRWAWSKAAAALIDFYTRLLTGADTTPTGAPTIDSSPPADAT